MPIDALSVFAQLTRDLLAIAKFLLIDVLSGVPQGSVLGPRAICYNLGDGVINKLHLLKFADDTKILVKYRDGRRCEANLHQLFQWSQYW